MLGNISDNKSNIYEWDWSKFDRENFILDNFSVGSEDILKTHELNADNSTKTHLDKINMFLGTYATLERINKYKMKLKSKPWITFITYENQYLWKTNYLKITLIRRTLY